MYQVTWLTTNGIRSITTPSWANAFAVYVSMKMLGVSARLWMPNKRLFSN